jgi:hypothetical protein
MATPYTTYRSVIFTFARRVVLDNDQGVTGLYPNYHELKDVKSSADLQVNEPAAQPAPNPGIGELRQKVLSSPFLKAF